MHDSNRKKWQSLCHLGIAIAMTFNWHCPSVFSRTIQEGSLQRPKIWRKKYTEQQAVWTFINHILPQNKTWKYMKNYRLYIIILYTLWTIYEPLLTYWQHQHRSKSDQNTDHSSKNHSSGSPCIASSPLRSNCILSPRNSSKGGPLCRESMHARKHKSQLLHACGWK